MKLDDTAPHVKSDLENAAFAHDLMRCNALIDSLDAALYVEYPRFMFFVSKFQIVGGHSSVNFFLTISRDRHPIKSIYRNIYNVRY